MEFVSYPNGDIYKEGYQIKNSIKVIPSKTSIVVTTFEGTIKGWSHYKKMVFKNNFYFVYQIIRTLRVKRSNICLQQL